MRPNKEDEEATGTHWELWELSGPQEPVNAIVYIPLYFNRAGESSPWVL